MKRKRKCDLLWGFCIVIEKEINICYLLVVKRLYLWIIFCFLDNGFCLIFFILGWKIVFCYFLSVLFLKWKCYENNVNFWLFFECER